MVGARPNFVVVEYGRQDSDFDGGSGTTGRMAIERAARHAYRAEPEYCKLSERGRCNTGFASHEWRSSSSWKALSQLIFIFAVLQAGGLVKMDSLRIALYRVGCFILDRPSRNARRWQIERTKTATWLENAGPAKEIW